MIKSPINPNCSLKMGHMGPNLTNSMTTFHFGSTPKLFLLALQTPTNTKRCQKRSEDLLKNETMIAVSQKLTL